MFLLRYLLRIILKVTVCGDVGRLRGRLLVIANHPSVWDAILLGFFLPNKPMIVTSGEETDNRLVKFLLRWVNHQLINLNDPRSLKRIIKLLDTNHPVVIFPEGRVSTTGSLMRVYEVAALVVAKDAASLAAVYIKNVKGTTQFHLHVQEMSKLPSIPITAAKARRHKAVLQLQRAMQNMTLQAYEPEDLFYSLLEAINANGRHTKFIEDIQGKEESYQTLLKKSLALGRCLRRFSKDKEVLGILLPNSIATVALVFGAWAFRRVPALLNFTAGAEAMKNACTAANIRVIITSRKFLESTKLSHLVYGLKDIQIVLLEDCVKQISVVDRIWVLWAMFLPTLAIKRQDVNETAVILFTSGSEARSKGVMLSHRAIITNIRQTQAVMDFLSSDKFFNALPMYHAYGFTCCTILPILGGQKLFLYVSPLHYRLIPELVYRRNCTCVFGTSTFLSKYAKEARSYSFHKLRYVISGGEKLSEEVRKLWLEKFGLRIVEGYGCVESAPVLAINIPMFYKTGSVGRLLPGIEWRLEAIPNYPGGALHIRGSNLMSGYILCDEPGKLKPPKSAYGEGWHCTGDIVEVDEDGFLFIRGRVKRFAKVAGEMVSLELVERIATHASPQHYHAAIIQPDVARGELIILYSTDQQLQRGILQQAARNIGAPELAVPRQVIFINDMPLLGVGKIDYVKLRESTA